MYNGIAGLFLAFALCGACSLILAPFFGKIFVGFKKGEMSDIGIFFGLFVSIIPASLIMNYLSNL